MNNEKKELTLGSLFSGSGGFELAGILSGIRPVWASEVAPFPIRVTTKRLPSVRHYGDVSKLSGAELEPVDIITFGSPCQDLSVAGKRAGIHDGARSSLFFEAIRIIKEMRDSTYGEKPRYALWENVDGCRSSNGGEDFKAVLEAFIGVREPGAEVPAPHQGKWPAADVYMGDGWSVAYRLLDAQGWGVPQRRKRIYLVADFAGGRAGEILFKSEGLSGYSAARFNAWKGAARDPSARPGEAGGGICLMDQGGDRMDVRDEAAGTLRAEAHHPPCVMAAGFCTEHSADSRSVGYEDEKAPTLRAGAVPAAIALEHHPNDSRIGIADGDVAQTLAGRMGTGGGNVPLVMSPDGPFLPYTLKIRSGREGGGKGALIQEDLSATLATANDQALFEPTAYGISSDKSNAMLSGNPHSGIYEAETSRTLDASGGTPACNQGGIAVVEPFDVRFTSEGTRNARGHCRPTGMSRCLDTGGELPDSNHGGVAVVETFDVIFALEGPSRAWKPCRPADTAHCLDTSTKKGSVAVVEPMPFAQNQRDEVRDLGGAAGALAAEPGTHQQTFVLQGSMIGRSEGNGPQGDGVNEGVSFTLNTADRHAVAFADAHPAPRAKDGPGGVHSQMQGEPEGSFVAEPVYSSTVGSYMASAEEVAQTLMARDYKDPQVVGAAHYTVRRLTPTECARLQGFPDWWCRGLGTPDPTEEDIAFWTGVFEEHRRTVTHAKKPKTRNQIVKWLRDPHSDSEEYKLWGNGIALPCAWFVLAGIVYHEQNGG